MIAKLTIDDAPALQGLLERCSEFWELVEGVPPAADTAVKELTSMAPGKTADDTFTFGVFEDDRLIAFAHVTRDCPKPSEWWIALLMLDPSQRGRGLGAEIHREIVEWVAAHGGASLWLAVQTQNERAEKFWLRQGYVDRGRQAYVAASGLKGTVILMSLSFGSRLSAVGSREKPARSR
jgi:GNAT superfamily N-acetyltransferase